MRRWIVLCFVAGLLVLGGVAAAGPDAGKDVGSGADAGVGAGVAVDAGPAVAAGAGATPAPVDAGTVKPSPEVVALGVRARRVRALMRGELDVAVDPASLFDVPLDDPRSIAVEVRRLRAVVAVADAAIAEAAAARQAARLGGVLDGGLDDGAGGRPKAADVGRAARRPAAAKDAGLEAGAGDVGLDAGDGDAGRKVAARPEDPEEQARWEARLELDRATLAFLELPAAARAGKLALHAKRQQDAGAAERQRREARERERKAKLVADEALEQARRADDQREKRLLTERARLSAVDVELSQLDNAQLARVKALAERPNVRLGWQDERDRLLKEHAAGAVSDSRVDAFRAEVFAALTESQRELGAALDALSAQKSQVPELGPDRLEDLRGVIDVKAVDQLRAKLERKTARLRQRERDLKQKLAGLLVQEIEALNAVRLSIRPYLSDAKRDRLSSLGAEGRGQAAAELTQIVLLLRYHVSLVTRFFAELSPGRWAREERLDLYWGLFKYLALLLVFGWWYRRADGVLGDYQARVAEARRRQPGKERLVELVRRVRRPAEWLVLLFLLRALLPAHVRQLFEVRLVSTVLVWILGGTVAVETVDALLTSGRRNRRMPEVAELRLGSLRLVGRIVVVFGITLSMSQALAGAGTIHRWAVLLCWWAALPTGVVLIYRWRDVIFQRVNLRQKHTPLTGWVVSHEDDWLRFLAATAGGIYLLARGMHRVGRGWLGGFDVSRRLLAYWFRREVDRKEGEEQKSQAELSPLDAVESAALDPTAEAWEIVPSVADTKVARVVEVIDAPGGGVFAVVGERGAGKTTLLRRIAEVCQVELISCPPGGVEAFWPELRRVLELPKDADLAAIGAALDARGDDTAILVDDAHHLVRPVIGGLDEFDRLLELARRSSARGSTWVFVLDSVIWQFFQRARGARPLFDEVVVLEPWTEEGIARLLAQRAADAGIEPGFDVLLRDLPDDADDIDRADARRRAETNTFRLLWDYSRGNPAVALHFWRESLRRDGARHVVRLFRPPDTSDIERLPDDSVFVLRAVVQLEEATIADVAEATLLGSAAVADCLRYSLARGYLELEDGRYQVALRWFRAITNVLKRRHLLASGEG